MKAAILDESNTLQAIMDIVPGEPLEWNGPGDFHVVFVDDSLVENVLSDYANYIWDGEHFVLNPNKYVAYTPDGITPAVITPSASSPIDAEPVEEVTEDES